MSKKTKDKVMDWVIGTIVVLVFIAAITGIVIFIFWVESRHHPLQDANERCATHGGVETLHSVEKNGSQSYAICRDGTVVDIGR